MKALSFFNRIIEYSFYAILLTVPLFFLGNTSELFEMNKMWLTFILTIIIAVSWISKMIIEKKIVIQKTPLDIPLLLFIISMTISTIFSLDSHISLWGYYTRFNGGLFSILSYILLYYAFVSNLQLKHVFRALTLTIITGILVALWGLPSHFGYDPTCFLFRGSLDTACWTDAFKPTIRAFSTLGQPAWFAAYLNILIPLTLAYALIKAHKNKTKSFVAFLAILLLFYISLIFAYTRAGSIAFVTVNILFWAILFLKKIFPPKLFLKYFLIVHVSFAVCSFLFGTTFTPLDQFTLPQIIKKFTVHAQTEPPAPAKTPVIKPAGITDSAQIRLIVWRGALEAWKANPIFGTGVETFAFAYYKHRPAEHNLTSEWDYLYNKAHNEYLNYLTTTGIVGLGAYLAIILFFLITAGRYILTRKETSEHFLFTLALISGYLTILITNFFGFSVVIINLYLFLIPAFVFLLTGILDPEKKYTFPGSLGISSRKNPLTINGYQWTSVIIILILGIYMIIGLFRYWYADTLYALGANLDRVSGYQQAFPLLDSAVNLVPNEPVYTDELAVNLATLSQALYLQKDASLGAQLARKAIELNNQLVENHPNNLIFWKNRLRVFYSLATVDTQNQQAYTVEALKALRKSAELAPTDAKISYNLGILVGQTGDAEAASSILENTIKLKPDYMDAYIALGQTYRQLALGQTASASAGQTILNPEYQQKAIQTYQFILDNLSPDNEQITKTLQEWQAK